MHRLSRKWVAFKALRSTGDAVEVDGVGLELASRRVGDDFRVLSGLILDPCVNDVTLAIRFGPYYRAAAARPSQDVSDPWRI
jgi:hypothetical protein